ncbi:DAK2 domain-containing protein [Mycetocola tolaasinivorans]|uniref:DAK2 domain-containing protein n=1 Tax=Mycetocola tolaasinivorans TaxID=76635 RepID=A0A3L7A9Y8_9MICO|nr:dihydroxyacetone kinase family protein [Mycetocola tolaasinivorans]RLP77246.1 DAK2 domain-containing protein [Mycetocola tolaasinivorans]
MRKIINAPDRLVDEVMAGIFLAHPDRVRPVTSDHRTLARVDAPAPGRVGIVTGGGSGHLPFFLGYVGTGLCSAVAIGNVFSSPSSAQIYAASRAVASDAGLLYLYGNYGGDVYNFDLAADLCRAEGIEVETVLGTDDILSASEADRRRGVAGLVLVYRVAGAAADRLWPLPEVARVAAAANAATRTMGVGLSPTILPAAGEATFELDPGEMEVGIGIHGERGRHRGPLETADEITDRFLAELETELDLTAGARVAVLVNGLGATPLEELYVIYRRVHEVLGERGVTIAYRLVGEYVTSLEMAGASVSIMQLDAELEDLLADPADSPFFHQDARPAGAEVPAAPPLVDAALLGPEVMRTGTPSRVREVLLASLPHLQAHTDELRDLDAALGDGDLGITVGAGSRAIVDALTALPEDADDAGVVRTAALAFAAANPSTFAALVSAGLLGAASEFTPGERPDSERVARFLERVRDTISERGGAQLGDKTLLDVLHPLIAVVRAAPADLPTALREHAERAVTETAGWESRRGRAAWQGERTRGQRDPGGVAVARLVDELRL